MTASTVPPGRHQRRLRNYLLDPRFQLKYTAYLVGVTLLLSIALGGALWWTSSAVLAQSHMAVSQGEEAVAQGQQLAKLGRKVVRESQKVSKVVEMNIVKEYADEPELAKVFKEEARKRDAQLAREQKEFEERAEKLRQKALDLKAQSAAISAQQTTMFVALLTALTVLVIGIGVASILVTHRIAGPVYKMKRQLKDVGKGRLQLPSPLRRGDELVDFFAAFDTMVRSLRARQEAEIEKLDRAIAHLESHETAEEAVRPLRELRGEMQQALDA